MSFALPIRHLQNGFHRFFFSFLYESAGVDNNDIGLGFISDNFEAILGQMPQHNLRIDQIPWAAQADQTDFLFFQFYGFLCKKDQGQDQGSRVRA
jgi:hypothetical protein